MAMKKFSDAKAEHGFAPTDHVDSIPFGGNEGGAWCFMLLARQRGWDVTQPVPNGFGGWFVYIWSYGPEDAPEYLSQA